MSAIRTPAETTAQETAALILRAQLDAADLLLRAEREERAGAVGLLLSLEQVREIAGRMQQVCALKEREHLAIYGADGSVTRAVIHHGRKSDG